MTLYHSSTKKQISPKQVGNQTRHDFLLTFFDDNPRYEFKEVNGYILVRQWNGGTTRWEVAIYTKESFNHSREYLYGSNKSLKKELNQRMEQLSLEE